jgi:hypothetical protein
VTAQIREHAISDREAAHGRLDAPRVTEQCEGVIAELFDVAPSTALFGRGSSTTGSLHAQLSTLYARCDARRDDWAALDPGPRLNACLTRLVAIARGDFSQALDEASHSAITFALRARIAGDAGLARQARELREIAARAETQLEFHYSRLLRARAEQAARARRTTLRQSASSSEGFAATRDRASSSQECERAASQDRGRSSPGPATLGEPARAGIAALRQLFGEFPYFEGYVQLIGAELRLLARPAAPLFLRDRNLARLDEPLRSALRSLQQELAGFLREPLSLGTPADTTFAVCGCGPLPLSALLLQLATGAHVVLIDESEPALQSARELVDALVEAGVVPRAALSFKRADAAALRFGRGLPAQPDSVACDVVLVASLIPGAAKRALAQQLRAAAPSRPLAVVMRSASGLCADLIYAPLNTQQLCDLRLVFCGESIPRHQLYETLDTAAAARHRLSAYGSRELLAIADPQVLNTSELYYRIPCDPPRDPLAGAPREWKVRDLEQASRWLRAQREPAGPEGSTP